METQFNKIFNAIKAKSGIKIKKANKGKFTDYCGGKVTNECINKGLNSSDPAVRKRANFARNARKWQHSKGGPLHSFKFTPNHVMDSNPNLDNMSNKKRKYQNGGDTPKLNWGELLGDIKNTFGDFNNYLSTSGKGSDLLSGAASAIMGTVQAYKEKESLDKAVEKAKMSDMQELNSQVRQMSSQYGQKFKQLLEGLGQVLGEKVNSGSIASQFLGSLATKGYAMEQRNNINNMANQASIRNNQITNNKVGNSFSSFISSLGGMFQDYMDKKEMEKQKQYANSMTLSPPLDQNGSPSFNLAKNDLGTPQPLGLKYKELNFSNIK